MPLTEGQLRSKRDEFWDTAPAFEGRKEIWDALRAAAVAAESTDFMLAQAILDGANVSVPNGELFMYCDSGVVTVEQVEAVAAGLTAERVLQLIEKKIL